MLKQMEVNRAWRLMRDQVSFEQSCSAPLAQYLSTGAEMFGYRHLFLQPLLSEMVRLNVQHDVNYGWRFGLRKLVWLP